MNDFSTLLVCLTHPVGLHSDPFHGICTSPTCTEGPGAQHASRGEGAHPRAPVALEIPLVPPPPATDGWRQP